LPLNDFQKEGLLKLEKRGYLPQLRKMAMDMSVAFYWSSQEDGKNPEVLHNGSMCYVRTPERALGITAHHVYKQYLKDLAEKPTVHAQFGGNTIYPEKRFIEGDENLDLATFDVPEVFVAAGHHYHHTPIGWPTPRLQPGEVVLYGGYPGSLREVELKKEQPSVATFPFQTFAWRVSEVTEQNIVMVVDFENLFWPEHEGEKINENPGGASGGPVYRVIESSVDRLEIVGFIYEYHDAMELMLARHADVIKADGTIVKP
jgi:hypothetical protein